ncbi:hypothetical protein [Streptomyces sp. NBC_01304]|uniref:hypothetical protein n=1 Tax=Streptomyces sp. NBC_01304 TaxID=2903818 RepID=UPI002E11723D|nr:hypothetical protein OG430_49155 [Streptomyces sp. NBC_01304]
MRHLPRHNHVLTTQLTDDAAPECCGGFKAVKIRVGGRLVTIHCSECVPSPGTASVIDDVHEEDEAEGYETEDQYAGAVAR